MSKTNDLETRVAAIEQRNAKVEGDKVWETSLLRRGFIFGATYLIALWYMSVIEVEDAYLAALIPSGGYLLSTLGLQLLRRWSGK